MLTSTFSLAAISVEQQHAHQVLSSFERNLQSLEWEGAAGMASDAIEAACQKLLRFAEFFHSRIIEAHVIPALHQSAMGLDSTFSELDALSAEADEVLHSIAAQVANRERCGFDIADLCTQVGRYCQCQSHRVVIENTRLLPSACDLLPSEVWFSIGAACLNKESRQHKVGPASSQAGRNRPRETPSTSPNVDRP